MYRPKVLKGLIEFRTNKTHDETLNRKICNEMRKGKQLPTNLPCLSWKKKLSTLQRTLEMSFTEL